jgi:hypothetical protein
LHATAIARRLRIARPRRLASALATLASLGVCALGASPAVADGCPNEQLRSENNSARLPECRAYERVTPSYTEGFPVENPYVSDAGALEYISTGSFAGNGFDVLANQYVSTRSSAGWMTTGLNPSAAMLNVIGANGADALSTDFRSSLWKVQGSNGYYYLLRGPDGSFTPVGSTEVPGLEDLSKLPDTELTSADLSHIVFAHGTTGSGTPGRAAMYEFVGTGNEGPPLPVSVDNDGDQVPPEAHPAAISTDGRVIAFSSGTSVGVTQLWARVGGSATVAVSGSECTRTLGDPGAACNALARAQFVGMAADGSRVFFTTTQQLVNGDTDQTSDLYECEIPPGAPAPVGTANPCASLTEVSGGATGANVQSVVKVSADGSHVYFTARGVLAANLGTNDAAPVAGDENLYVWEKDAAHPGGQTAFVTKLDSGLGFLPQTTPDGRYLVFSSSDRLLGSDTDEAQDVYRYDAQTRTLLRLSTATSGTAGNEPGLDATLFFDSKAVSSDGSTVIFDTAEALSPADTDGTEDVYEWHEGHVSLISSGGGHPIGISSSGQDIYFSTGQPLTGGDSGSQTDFYDARVDGGFPVATTAVCSGEGCQGATPPQPQSPGTSASAAFNGPGSPIAGETPPANTSKPKPLTAAQKLAKALKACKVKHNKKKRATCEKRARNTYRRASK